jgi:hypothetical protein
MGDYSTPKHDGLRDGMVPPEAHSVVAVVLATTDGIVVSVPQKVSDQIGQAATERLMDALAEAAATHLIRVQ